MEEEGLFQEGLYWDQDVHYWFHAMLKRRERSYGSCGFSSSFIKAPSSSRSSQIFSGKMTSQRGLKLQREAQTESLNVLALTPRLDVNSVRFNVFKFPVAPSKHFIRPSHHSFIRLFPHPSLPPRRQLKRNYSAEQEYPNLTEHNDRMAKVLTPEMSIWGFCLPPHCSRGERPLGEILKISSGLKDMTDDEQQQLIDDQFFFNKPVSPLLLASGMVCDWPDACGIWHNNNKTFLVWVNEDEVISMQKGGNMKEVFNLFCAGLTKIQEQFKAKGLCGGFHVKLPNVSKHEKFGEILKRLRLQKRGTGGVDTAAVGRLGFSGVELVQMVVDAVELLVEMEKRLEASQSIDGLMPEQKKILHDSTNPPLPPPIPFLQFQ
ncbi:hypothetical protein DNTS_025773 [Danionella cerebrum]|uniref:creatine kinase n=1 Tax=Danionella cerebrum TaxID=2873325 RepID=A0A553N4L7_9TELE|nr:hypothetical protein DNTS_025773 [Danionella translucida]